MHYLRAEQQTVSYVVRIVYVFLVDVVNNQIAFELLEHLSHFQKSN